MRLITYIFLFTSLNAFSSDADSLFAIGNYHYENEVYEKAIESYLAIDSIKHANSLYHNLGNCYYQTGDIARSILFYERALLLKKDSKTQENLNLAKKRIQEIESIPTLFFIHWWNSIARFLDTELWTIITSIFVWIGCFLLFLFLKNRQKRTFNLFLTAIAFTFLLALITQRSNHLSKKTYAIVMKKTALLSNISESKSKLIITPGNKIEIIDFNREFSIITLPNGESGWCHSNNIIKL
tara:strand:- start:258 stop:977 length:720 start_codon:yes stop_codon:yes gene_type:complete